MLYRALKVYRGRLHAPPGHGLGVSCAIRAVLCMCPRVAGQYGLGSAVRTSSDYSDGGTMPSGSVCTRFAPSPTGELHLGGLRTALFNLLLARSGDGAAGERHGCFLLRIEDTDRARLVPGQADKLVAVLKRFGLVEESVIDSHVSQAPPEELYPDGVDGQPAVPFAVSKFDGSTVIVQSWRKRVYGDAADALLKTGVAYKCFCTKDRLEQLRLVQSGERTDFTGYDGRCRDLDAAVVSTLERQLPHTLRLNSGRALRAYQSAAVEWGRDDVQWNGKSVVMRDGVFGTVQFSPQQVDDFVLVKACGMPTYHFANVVDDSAMRVTHVMRGEEWLSSVPKHVLLYAAMGAGAPPIFAHVPLLLDTQRRKLSKRHAAGSVEQLVKVQAILPSAILHAVSRLGWTPPSDEALGLVPRAGGEDGSPVMPPLGLQVTSGATSTFPLVGDLLRRLAPEFRLSGLRRSACVVEEQAVAHVNVVHLRYVAAALCDSIAEVEDRSGPLDAVLVDSVQHIITWILDHVRHPYHVRVGTYAPVVMDTIGSYLEALSVSLTLWSESQSNGSQAVSGLGTLRRWLEGSAPSSRGLSDMLQCWYLVAAPPHAMVVNSIRCLDDQADGKRGSYEVGRDLDKSAVELCVRVVDSMKSRGENIDSEDPATLMGRVREIGGELGMSKGITMRVMRSVVTGGLDGLEMRHVSRAIGTQGLIDRMRYYVESAETEGRERGLPVRPPRLRE